MAQLRSAAIIAALGFGVGLAGDACHVASGTTRYEWDGVPEIWRSRAWFPFLVAGAVLFAAWMGRRAGLPERARSRVDVVIGAAVVLALYALTAVLKGQPATVSVVLTGAIAVGVVGSVAGRAGDRRRRRRRGSARRDRAREPRRRELRGRQRRPRGRRAVAAVPVLRGRGGRVRPLAAYRRSGPRSGSARSASR